MSNADRIEELRNKYEENPRRYFAPLANEFRKAGDLAQAIAICREHLPKQPGHMSGFIVFGQTLFEANSLDEARSVFEQALALDPENLIALKHLGDIARMKGENAVARRWYERVLDADPRNDDIAAQLASLSMPTPPLAMPAIPSPLVTSVPLQADDSNGVFRTFDPGALLDIPEDVITGDTVRSQWEPRPTAQPRPAPTHEPIDLDFPEHPEPVASNEPEPEFEEGLLAPEWPDTADLVARVVTPFRGVTPLSVPATPDAVAAFGREANDAREAPLLDTVSDDVHLDDSFVDAYVPASQETQQGTVTASPVEMQQEVKSSTTASVTLPVTEQSPMTASPDAVLPMMDTRIVFNDVAPASSEMQSGDTYEFANVIEFDTVPVDVRIDNAPVSETHEFAEGQAVDHVADLNTAPVERGDVNAEHVELNDEGAASAQAEAATSAQAEAPMSAQAEAATSAHSEAVEPHSEHDELHNDAHASPVESEPEPIDTSAAVTDTHAPDKDTVIADVAAESERAAHQVPTAPSEPFAHVESVAFDGITDEQSFAAINPEVSGRVDASPELFNAPNTLFDEPVGTFPAESSEDIFTSQETGEVRVADPTIDAAFASFDVDDALDSGLETYAPALEPVTDHEAVLRDSSADATMDAIGDTADDEGANSELLVAAATAENVHEQDVAAIEPPVLRPTPHGVDSQSPAFVTETMAELLVKQGFVQRAIEIYEELVRRRAYDPVLSSRLAELRSDEFQQAHARMATPARATPLYTTPHSVTPVSSAATAESQNTAPPMNAEALPYRTARQHFVELANRRVSRRTPTHATAISDDAAEGLSSLFGSALPTTPDELAARALADAFGPVQDSGESLFDPPAHTAPAVPLRSPTPRSNPAIHAATGASDSRGGRAGGNDYSFDRFFPDPAVTSKPVAAESTFPSTTAVSQTANEDLAGFSAWLKGLNNA